jgi:hypothetical protein
VCAPSWTNPVTPLWESTSDFIEIDFSFDELNLRYSSHVVARPDGVYTRLFYWNPRNDSLRNDREPRLHEVKENPIPRLGFSVDRPSIRLTRSNHLRNIFSGECRRPQADIRSLHSIGLRLVKTAIK